MAERVVLQPPEIVSVGDKPIIFLAGPIQGAPDWQAEAIDCIHDLAPQVIVASPRKDYAPGTFVYEKQVDWETHYLRRASKLGVVSFWLAAQAEETPGRAYAQTTRFELGEWTTRYQYQNLKLTVGIDDAFGNACYIRRRLSQDCPSLPIADTLKSMCESAVLLTQEPYQLTK